MQSEFLRDFTRDVSRLCGVLHGVLLEERFFANRAHFLLDRTGIVQWAHVEENPSRKRSSAERLEHIGAVA